MRGQATPAQDKPAQLFGVQQKKGQGTPLFGQPQPGQAGGLFGAQPQPVQAGGLFGGQPQPAQGGGGLFGGQPQPAQGGGLFGNKPQPALGGGLFANQPKKHEVPTLFGQLQPVQAGGLFGAQPQPVQAGGLFGGQPQQAQGGGGLFGNKPQPAQGGGGLFANQPKKEQGATLFGGQPGGLDGRAQIKEKLVKVGPFGEKIYKISVNGSSYYKKTKVSKNALDNYKRAFSIGIGPEVKVDYNDESFIMKEGVDILTAIKNGKLTNKNAIDQLRQLERTLIYHKLAHCDVKYDNCLYFEDESHILLIDNGELTPYGSTRPVKTAGQNSTLIRPNGKEGEAGEYTDKKGFSLIEQTIENEIF